MSFAVRLTPSNQTFSVPEGETIHSAAAAAGIGLPYSCMRGTCRTCRARVVEGEVHQKVTTLSPEDRAAGYALLCQSEPLTDVVIEARVLPMVPKSDVAKTLVSAMRLVAPDVMIVSLRLPPRKSLHYKAGQYIEIVLAGGQRRHYSLATVPRPEGNWEFDIHIRRCPGGLFTQRVFEAMKAREMLTVCGPKGTFFLREDSEKPIILVASGTGYAPIRALIQNAFQAAPNRDMRLYWGGRVKADLYMADEPAAWQAQHERFSFVPVLSDALPQDAWTGRTGFVHQAVMDDFPDLSRMQVYACGAPVMVNAARRDFIAACGLPQEEFFADSFLTEADMGASAPPG